MQWERMTAPALEKAVRETGGVAIVPVGSLEQHATHLPVGADGLVVYECARRAVEKEPAVLVPLVWYSQVTGAANAPGCISLDLAHVLRHLDGICDEVARNGFEKVIILNIHGGNTNILAHLLNCLLQKEKPYVAYLPQGIYGGKEFAEITTVDRHGHACECETSVNLALFPELVGPLPKGEGKPRPARNLRNIVTAVDWYERYPHHYAGDARPATKETGEKLARVMVDRIVDAIRQVKADEKTQEVLARYARDHAHPHIRRSRAK